MRESESCAPGTTDTSPRGGRFRREDTNGGSRVVGDDGAILEGSIAMHLQLEPESTAGTAA